MADVPDPVDVVREARHRISESLGHDPARVVEHYRKLQQEFRDRLLVEDPAQAADAKRGQPPENRTGRS